MAANSRTHVPVLKSLKELTMLDRFLFAQAMEDPVVSQHILQIILNEDIHLLDKTETEKEFRISPLARSIRVDVYSMDDGATRIFLNTHGTDLCGCTGELAELLHYMEHSTGESPYPVESPRIQEIHRHVEAIRSSEEMGVRYMQEWEERLMDREEGKNAGSLIHLITLIQKKHLKGQSIRDIAEAVEESPDIIQPYYDAIQEHPEYSAEDIYYCTLDEEPE